MDPTNKVEEREEKERKKDVKEKLNWKHSQELTVLGMEGKY